jgi:uroporphyrinogen decarboxylase
VQGNLDPALVLAGLDTAIDATRIVLSDNADSDGSNSDGSGHTGHIFNLGHGVQPETDPDVLAAVVEFVHKATAR